MLFIILPDKRHYRHKLGQAVRISPTLCVQPWKVPAVPNAAVGDGGAWCRAWEGAGGAPGTAGSSARMSWAPAMLYHGFGRGLTSSLPARPRRHPAWLGTILAGAAGRDDWRCLSLRPGDNLVLSKCKEDGNPSSPHGLVPSSPFSWWEQ